MNQLNKLKTMKKILILLLFAPLLSIGQTFSSTSVLKYDVNEHGVKSLREQVKGVSTIVIGKDMIMLTMVQDKPTFLKIESIKRTSKMIHYYIEDDEGSTVVYHDNIENVKTIFLNVFSHDNSGTIFVFLNCKKN